MKPMNLHIQAFGSYGSELDIDFSRLGLHGIFAVSGPTGSGKTTIFDAIVYALYGELPGYREDGDVRSQYADSGVETRVSLEFEVSGELWLVERVPAQSVPKTRGDGMTQKAMSVVLMRVDQSGLSMTKKSDVTAKIHELIGLTQDQFQQVVLIPQGKFEEVLKSPTTDRAKLLRKLFPVEIFSNVSEHLKEEADRREGILKEVSTDFRDVTERLRSSVATALGQIPDDLAHNLDESELTEDRFNLTNHPEYSKTLKNVLLELKGRVSIEKESASKAQGAFKSAESAAKRFDSWKEKTAESENFVEQERIDKETSVRVERAKQVETLSQLIDQWEESTTVLTLSQTLSGKIIKRLEKADLANVDRKMWLTSKGATSLSNRLANEGEKLEKASEIFLELVAAGEELKQKFSELAEESKEADASVNELKIGRENLAKANKKAKVLRKSEKSYDALLGELEKIETKITLAEDVRKLESELKISQKDMVTAEGQEKRAVEVLTRRTQSWRKSLAVEVVGSLKPGLACPVCGSKDHPHPVKKTLGAVTSEHVAAASAQVEEAREILNAAKQEVAEIKASLKTLGSADDLVSLRKNEKVLQGKVHASEKAISELEELEESIEEDAEGWEEFSDDLDEILKEIASEGKALKSREARLDSDKAKYTKTYGAFASMAKQANAAFLLSGELDELVEVLTEIESANKTIGDAEKVLIPRMKEFGVKTIDELAEWSMGKRERESLEADLLKRTKNRQLVRQFLLEYKQNGEPTTRPNVEELRIPYEDADARYQDIVVRFGIVKEHLDVLNQAPALLKSSQEQIAKAREEFEVAKNLASICAGTSSGSVGMRLSLENWVLSDYLRQVLLYANLRLDIMTNGRYSLEVTGESTDARRASGLDLSVFDVNTGQLRPATTLSGGETFMAALSLALGLADVVSSGSNREMGALFIDEGFGSLDPQSLDSVIDVLRSLEDGGRVVGVISHVDELKQALPNGITISSSNGGSIAQVIYPAA